MPGVFGLSVLLVVITTVFGQGDRFPTCGELLDAFGNEGVNLFTDGEGIRNILSTECITEESRYESRYKIQKGLC